MADTEAPTSGARSYRRLTSRQLPRPYRAACIEKHALPDTAFRIPAAPPTYTMYRWAPTYLLSSAMVTTGFQVRRCYDYWSDGLDDKLHERLIWTGLAVFYIVALLGWMIWRFRKSRDGRPPFGLLLVDDCLIDVHPMRRTVIPHASIESLHFFERDGFAWVRIASRSVKPRHHNRSYGPYYAVGKDVQQRVVRWYDAHQLTLEPIV